MERYIDTVFTKLLQDPAEQSFPGVSRVLRVYCHLAIWMKNTAFGSTDLEMLIPEDLFQLAVESYAEHLIIDQKRLLVAAYCAHLTGPRRVTVYSRLLLSMSGCLPSEGSGGGRGGEPIYGMYEYKFVFYERFS